MDRHYRGQNNGGGLSQSSTFIRADIVGGRARLSFVINRWRERGAAGVHGGAGRIQVEVVSTVVHEVQGGARVFDVEVDRADSRVVVQIGREIVAHRVAEGVAAVRVVADSDPGRLRAEVQRIFGYGVVDDHAVFRPLQRDAVPVVGDDYVVLDAPAIEEAFEATDALRPVGERMRRRGADEDVAADRDAIDRAAASGNAAVAAGEALEEIVVDVDVATVHR